MFIAGGISAALFHREKTGEAVELDVSLLSTAWWASGRADGAVAETGVDHAQRRCRVPAAPRAIRSWAIIRTSDGGTINLCTIAYQEVHRRNDRMRLRLLRLRQRRLDGRLHPRRHAARGRSAGRHQSALQEQSRRHVHRRDRESRTPGRGVGVRRLRRRLQQRWLRGSLLHVLRPEPAVSQQRRRDLHRRDESGRALEPSAAMGSRLQLPRLRPRRTPRSLRLELRPVLVRACAGAGREQQLQLEGDSGALRSARPSARPAFAVSQQRRRDVHGRDRTCRHHRRRRRATA